MVKGYLFRRFAPLIALSVWSGSMLLPAAAYAEVPLNRAVVASLRNAVELILKNKAPRAAKVRDALMPGDAIATARAALAELRFNDGSLARVGGQALFRFLPNTRTFQLSNGTLLLLVPPGRGQTRIQTPNAAAGIRGSALFVRYLPETDVTLIGALTDSGIEITNRDRSQSQPLGAGQIAVVVKNRIEQVYRFDLKTFYETSELVKGLELQRSALSDQSTLPTDQAIAAVRAETSEAVKIQASLEFGSAVTATGGQPLEANTKPSLSNQIASPSTNPLNQLAEPSKSVTLPINNLLAPPTAALTTTFPPTVTLPLTGAGNGVAATSPQNPTAGLAGATPEQNGIPPGLAGTTPGQSVNSNTPGRNGSLPPGLAGTTPGQSGNTPGQNGSLPPGLAGTTPGQLGNTPGQNGSLPPGRAGTTPGQSGNTPGQNGSLPPGLAGTTPGQLRNTPGRARLNVKPVPLVIFP